MEKSIRLLRSKYWKDFDWVLLAAALLIAFFYQRSYIKYRELRRVLDAKHTVNMGQVYTFGLAQRQHDEVAQGQGEAETELRERFGLMPHGMPQLTTADRRTVGSLVSTSSTDERAQEGQD